MKTLCKVFCERLKSIMQNKGISCNMLAKNVGVDMRTLKKWINGERLPRLKHALNLCDFFEVRLDYLFDCDDC